MKDLLTAYDEAVRELHATYHTTGFGGPPRRIGLHQERLHLADKIEAIRKEILCRIDSVEMSLMYLETGFLECDRCGHEVDTKTLDAVYELRRALGVPDEPPSPAAKAVDQKLAELFPEWEADQREGIASILAKAALEVESS